MRMEDRTVATDAAVQIKPSEGQADIDKLLVLAGHLSLD